jgi:hypothetical protein
MPVKINRQAIFYGIAEQSPKIEGARCPEIFIMYFKSEESKWKKNLYISPMKII